MRRQEWLRTLPSLLLAAVLALIKGREVLSAVSTELPAETLLTYSVGTVCYALPVAILAYLGISFGMDFESRRIGRVVSLGVSRKALLTAKVLPLLATAFLAALFVPLAVLALGGFTVSPIYLCNTAAVSMAIGLGAGMAGVLAAVLSGSIIGSIVLPAVVLFFWKKLTETLYAGELLHIIHTGVSVRRRTEFWLPLVLGGVCLALSYGVFQNRELR